MIRTEPTPTGKAFTALERIPVTVCTDDAEAARYVAGVITETLRRNQGRSQPIVLGLATGHTLIGVYRELIRLHHEEDLDFSGVVTFNLDEYYPIEPDAIQSRRRWMQEHFFDHVNIPAGNIHVPDGALAESEVPGHCQAYEDWIEAAGGIDIQLLGIGRTGRIGLNEPGSSSDSPTRLIVLDPTTRRDAAADFFGEANVPYRAITLGVGTILRARKILLLAFNEQKAPIVRRAVQGPASDAVAASFLQHHRDAEIILDRAAAADLTRVATPWLLGDIEWSPENQRRAVVWLSLETGKSILKLDQDDYDVHHLASLVRHVGSADRLNHQVFTRLSETITYKTSLPANQTILCFSPHPDDDVISMGGTATRLVQRGNRVHSAYMTSGNVAVSDEHALQMLKFWSELNDAFRFDSGQTRAFDDKIRSFLASKHPGAADSPEVQEIKKQIRRSEALAACQWTGIPPENAHFLDLPFYQTGQVRKRPIGSADVEIILQLICQLRPHWIFAAGELSDPHGTHRLCTEAIFAALQRCTPEERPETVWLYRGAWQEWEPDAIDMVIPLSRSELTHKIFGIFKHQSQKDKALFPGPYDDREFWQRAEARNTDTAALFNKLGLPEHHAMEAFVRHEVF